MGVLKARVNGEWVPVMGDGGTVARWNSAWGVVTVGTWAATAPVVANGLVLANMGPFTPLAGRLYKMTVHLRAITPASTGVGGGFTVSGWRNGVTVATQSTWIWNEAIVNGWDSRTMVWPPFAGDGVASTWQLKTETPLGWGQQIYTDSPSAWFIEDVGPVTPSAPILNPTPAWANLTYTGSGWANSATGTLPQPAQIRKIGDEVQIRGFTQPTNAANPIFMLSPEYRPIRQQSMVGVARITPSYIIELRIYPDGTSQIVGLTGNHEITYNVRFSTT